MNDKKVKVTSDAKKDLGRYLDYIRRVLKNPQAARSVAEDFRETKSKLAGIADSLKKPDSAALVQRGLKRYNFLHHDYLLLFRVKGEIVEITNIFHASEDYENKLR